MNTMIRFILLSAIFFWGSLFAQTSFHRTYTAGDWTVFTDIAQLAQGDLVACGIHSQSVGLNPFRPFAARLNPQGDLVWAKSYQIPGISRANSICTTSDGGMVIAGYVDTLLGPGGNDDAFLLKLDSLGNHQWTTQLGAGDEETINRIYEAPNGDLVGVGTVENTTTNDRYFWFTRFSSSGTILNSFLYFPSQTSSGYALDFHPDGGYVLGGLGQENGDDGAFLFRISDSGVLQWYRSFGSTTSAEVIYDLMVESDKSVVFTGRRTNNGMFIGKADSLGNKEWFQDYGGNTNEAGWRVIPGETNGYLVMGVTEDLSGMKGPLLMDFDSDGIRRNAWVFGNDFGSTPMGFIRTRTGELVYGGGLLITQGTTQANIAKMFPNGESCNTTSGSWSPLMTITQVDTPAPYATTGTSNYYHPVPTVTPINFLDTTLCTLVHTADPAQSLFRIFPNPAGQAGVQLELPGTLPAEISVLNGMGQIVTTTQTSDAEVRIPTAGWAAGIYFVKVRTPAREAVLKLIIR